MAHTNIKTITAGDATTPATWLASLATPQLILDGAQNGVEIHATATAQTIYVAERDGDDTWHHLVLVTVPAYSSVVISCRAYRGLAFGVAGGATMYVTAFRA